MPLNRFAVLAGLALSAALAVGLAGSLAWAQEPAQPPPDPKAIVEGVCTGCHGLDFVAEHHKDHDGWDFTVRRMIDKGAELPYDAVPLVVDYLAKTYPPAAPTSAPPAADKPPG